MAEWGTVELVAERLGLALTAGRPAGDGQRRAYFADLAGTPVVVKWGLDPDLPEKLPYVRARYPGCAGGASRFPGSSAAAPWMTTAMRAAAR